MGVGSLEHSRLLTERTERSEGARVRWGLGCKRAIDIVVATALLLVLAPVMALLAVVILIAEGRPILFRQRRVGRHGHLFTIFKFRTMVPDAHDRLDEVAHTNDRHGPLFKSAEDPRVTRVGKFLRRSSLDELPQLFNVLTGTMSLVGPRPALPEERSQFPVELLEREQLPQGLSGLWQLEGRNNSDFGVYRELDLDYVRTWTLRRDLSILVRTPFVVFTHALRPRPAAPDQRRHVNDTVATRPDASNERIADEPASQRQVVRPVRGPDAVTALVLSSVRADD